MKRIAKAITAWLGSAAVAIGTWVGTLAPGAITNREWITLIVALVGPLLAGGLVYQVRNAPSGS